MGPRRPRQKEKGSPAASLHIFRHNTLPSLIIFGATWKTAENFADTGEKSYRAQDESQPRPGVQPMIEEIANRTSNHNRADESKRQLKRQRES